MALAQLLNRSCNSPDAVFRTIRDFLAAANGIDDFSTGGPNPGPGYEIVDESYASGDSADTTTNDWCVLRSYGEAASYPHYLHLLFGANQHTIKAYLHWDISRHGGFAEAYGYPNIYHNGAGEVRLYIHADLDECHVVILPRAVSNWYWHPFGRLKPARTLYSGQSVQVAEAIAAGEGVAVRLPSWPAWAEVGRKIYSWDTSSLHELTIVAASPESATITVETAYAKAAGSWLAEDVFLFAAGSHNISAGGNQSHVSGLPQRGAATTGATDNSYAMPLSNIPGRDIKYGRRLATDIWIQRSPDEVRGWLDLVRESNLAPAAQSEPWTDEADGSAWRIYTVTNGKHLAFREAI